MTEEEEVRRRRIRIPWTSRNWLTRVFRHVFDMSEYFDIVDGGRVEMGGGLIETTSARSIDL